MPLFSKVLKFMECQSIFMLPCFSLLYTTRFGSNSTGILRDFVYADESAPFPALIYLSMKIRVVQISGTSHLFIVTFLLCITTSSPLNLFLYTEEFGKRILLQPS